MNKTASGREFSSNLSSAAKQRLKERSEFIDSMKAKADAKRSVLDRLVDRSTALFGSKIFLAANALWFLGWSVINVGLLGIKPFDPYPFSMLTTAVSLEAIVLAISVLISQNRSAKVADLRDEINLQLNVIGEEEITKILRMLALLLPKNGIDLSGDPELQSMLQPTDTEKIEKTLEMQLTSPIWHKPNLETSC